MANDWRELADRLSGSRSSSSSANTSTSSNVKSSSGGSSGASGGSSNDWRGLAEQLSGSRKQTYSDYSNRVASRVITRAKEEEEKKKRKWFEKGLFEDGYDFGDISRTILGTTTDVLENVGSGIIGMGEKTVDALAYIAPYAENAQFYQNGGGYNPEIQKQHEKAVEQSKTELQKFIAKDLYDEQKVARAIISDPARKIGIDSETQSVFGEKSDALIQSGGQLLATAGLAAAGMPWWLTTGATSFGSEAENAMNQGASYEAAGASAAISAGAEILSEKLSGGISFGGKSLDDALTKQLARGISNKLGRTAAKLGLDMVGEGSEEVFSQLASNLGSSLYKEEDIAELLFSEEAMDGYLESFIGGAALGGVSNAYNAVKSNSKGVDYTSGLTQNEQKVVDKLYKDEVASREKEGKVTQKEKAEIYDRILNEMDKGYISVDTIEEVLGGEKYNQYKQTAEWENSLQTEFDTLNKMKQGDMTGEQVDRREALREQLKNVKATSSQTQLRSQIRDEVMGLVKGDRLAESYNERVRTGQKFEADVTKYDAKQQAVVQKAIDSGILNNSNRTHEFVDFVSKISADTGVLFDFSNTQKIREAGFAVEGQTVDGFITKDGITVNIDSPKSRQFVVGHEITHALEGTELYDALRQSVFDYAKMKNQYGVRMESIQKRYKEGTDFEAELTADLVGEYIFSDTDFINNLSTQNRNVFQKVYDEIKYLCKVATAGSKEARELEKVKRAFEKAYREGGKTQGETKYSISEIVDQNQKSYGVGVHLDSTLLDNLSPEERKVMVKERIKELGGEVFTAYDSNGNAVDITIAKPGATFKNQNGKKRPVNKDLTTKYIGNEVKQEAVVLIDELIATSKFQGTDPAKHSHGWLDNNGQNDWDVWTTYIQDKNNTIWEATLHIANTANGEKIVYDVDPTKKVGQSGNSDTSLHKDNVTQDSDNVKYSLSDSDGKQLTKEQQDYFKDSKMRDENGSLKVMYHGSQDAGFHTFDSSMSDDGTSFFFVDRNTVAASYSGTTETYAPRVWKSAEDANNFLKEIGYYGGYYGYEVVENNGKFTLVTGGEEIATSENPAEIYEEFCDYEGVGYGDANYKVYLNLKNPLEVDAEGREWDDVSDEFWPELYEQWKTSFTQEEKYFLADLAREGFGTFRNEIELSVKDAGKPTADKYTKALNSAYWKNSDMSSLFRMAADNFSDELLRAEAVKQMTTRDFAQKAKAEGYDGVIFKNIVDVGQYGGDYNPATVAIAFDSNQIKSVANAKPTADPDIRYSLSEGKTYAEIEEERMALNHRERELEARKREAVNNPELLQAMDNYSGLFTEMRVLLPKRKQGTATQAELDRIEEIKELREVYMNRVNELQDSLGLNAIAEEEREIREKKEALRVASDAAWAREGAEKENKAIAKAGIPAPEYFRKKALKAFKTTTNFNEAGYMLPDGKLLNFSGGERNHRYRDHREIGEIYEATNGVAALNRFLNDGNIRIMAESPGIDIASGVEPTKEQYAALRRFINTNGAKDGRFFVDFSDSEGRRAGNYSYNGRIFADRVINDIKYFFQTGKVRESSGLTDFLSLSNVGEQHTPDSLSALRFDAPTVSETENVAPVAENATQQQETQLTEENSTVAPVTADDMSALFPNNATPVQAELEQLVSERDQLYSALEIAVDRGSAAEVGKLAEEYEALNARIKALESTEAERTGSLTDAEVPAEMDAPYQPTDEDYEGIPETVDDPFEQRDISEVGKRSVNAYQYENPEVKPFFQEAALGMLYDVRNTTKGEKWYNDELYYSTGGEQGFGGTKRSTTDDIAELKDVYGYTYDQIEAGLNAIIEDDGAENNAVSKRIEFMLNDRLLNGYMDIDGRSYEPNQGYIKLLKEKQITEYSKEAFDQFMANADQYAPSLEESYAPILNSDPRYEQIAPVYDLPGGQQTYVPTKATYDAVPTDDIAPMFDATGKKGVPDGQQAFMPDAGVEKKQTRKEYHQSIIDNIKSVFKGRGFDFDKVLKDAKNLSTWSTVDNTPQRVMEKALGYKQGGILADITVNKVAQNETEGIKWLNAYVDQLKQISKQYGIKPGSKESAAAQMFAEGFYVNENNEIIRYGEPELIQDFGNADVRRRIKGLARDPRIRKIYDDTLANINESRARNLYPEIPRLDNYFLHFRAMEDTFSTLGLPFNPNDIRAKDLPTDLNGVTTDLKPGQPYFASANHRTGKRTSFDLLGGVERYLNSAKNQIYHIDDIQTLRALRNYIADSYGQAKGLENLDELSQDAQWEQIKKVYNSHLSTFAKFLNEEANILAGKTTLIDRGVEGVIGRRGITFLNALNKQVGSNMVGYNVSSSLTNFLPVAQAFAKTNKFDFTKAFAQTVANKLSGGRFDSFAEDSPVVIRRKGEDRFAKTLWQKLADPGYAMMGMVDDISTEIIARTKYNEFTRKGMDSQKAHFETDKWVSKLMGDRSLGQQPQLYNSKMLGLFTKFQLEVRNQLDSQFYDTIQEAKVSNEYIQNGLARNAKTAAKVTSVFAQLAVAQHLYGMAFESMAGYNPAFDIIEVLMTAFGYDDEEDSEDTLKDNLGQGFEALMEDLPYASIVTGGGRIPISSALPINELVQGKDQYGNDKSRLETLGEVAPYYLMPGGYGQAKKTYQGLKMFSDDHPIAGSYTDAGNLRFDVEDTVGSRIKAGIFGQYASENAQKYFDQEQRTLNPEQTEIFAGLNIPIEEYWEYRDNYNAFTDVKKKVNEAANADGATEEDIVRNRYFSSVSGELNDLYEKQKEIAKSDSPYKQQQLREIQDQMADILAKSDYESDIPVSVSGAYAEAGDRRFNYDAKKDFWYEIKPENDGEENWYYIQEQLSHDKLGISYEDFWNDRRTPSRNATYYAEYNGKRYNYDAEKKQWYEITPKNEDGTDNWYYQMEQEVTKGLGISYEEYWSKPKEYNFAYEKPGQYAVAQAVGGYDSYKEHYDVLQNNYSDNYLRADKDKHGNSIDGSRKKKVLDYINGLDLDYGERIILYRTVYSSKSDKRTYNQQIIDYLNERDDISYQEMKSILEELEMVVDEKGYIKW